MKQRMKIAIPNTAPKTRLADVRIINFPIIRVKIKINTKRITTRMSICPLVFLNIKMATFNICYGYTDRLLSITFAAFLCTYPCNNLSFFRDRLWIDVSYSRPVFCIHLAIVLPRDLPPTHRDFSALALLIFQH